MKSSFKKLFVCGAILLSTANFAQKKAGNTNGKKWSFEENPGWEDLKKETIPEWMLDAKLGFYTHWGIYSVPAHGGPDYIKELYSADDNDRKGVKKYHTEKISLKKDSKISLSGKVG